MPRLSSPLGAKASTKCPYFTHYSLPNSRHAQSTTRLNTTVTGLKILLPCERQRFPPDTGPSREAPAPKAEPRSSTIRIYNLFTMSNNSRQPQCGHRYSNRQKPAPNSKPSIRDGSATTISQAQRQAQPGGGAGRNRTDGLMLAKHALSQLSYGPILLGGPQSLVGQGRLELPTSRLSSARSNQLSYWPEARVATPKAPKRSAP